MLTSKEARVRIVISEFEARRSKAAQEARGRRWRLAITLLRIVVVVGAAGDVGASNWHISGAQACGLFLIFVAASAWEEHRKRETIHALELEVERLKERVEKQPG